ncbi:DUF1237 domain-containing protein [Pyricularia oryzae]|nr:DUF1237 domain-containing protein [Pyricularia oryzae]KAI7922388.1 DUF1237 domain-containing protein [Pyricularia oryzae]
MNLPVVGHVADNSFLPKLVRNTSALCRTLVAYLQGRAEYKQFVVTPQIFALFERSTLEGL